MARAGSLVVLNVYRPAAQARAIPALRISRPGRRSGEEERRPWSFPQATTEPVGVWGMGGLACGSSYYKVSGYYYYYYYYCYDDDYYYY